MDSFACTPGSTVPTGGGVSPSPYLLVGEPGSAIANPVLQTFGENKPSTPGLWDDLDVFCQGPTILDGMDDWLQGFTEDPFEFLNEVEPHQHLNLQPIETQPTAAVAEPKPSAAPAAVAEPIPSAAPGKGGVPVAQKFDAANVLLRLSTNSHDKPSVQLPQPKLTKYRTRDLSDVKPYGPEQRRAAIDRYLAKRPRRHFGRKIMYEILQGNANKRQRLGGRFTGQ